MNNISVKENKLCTKTLKLLGDFWTLKIIDSLKNGDSRYCEIQRNCDNLNPVTLTNRLQKLESAGLIEKKVGTQDKISVTYFLTPKGKSAIPVLDAINNFASKFKK